MFDKKTREYKGNLNVAFETAGLAKAYLHSELETDSVNYVIVKVDFYCN